jgi:hypothetical protein
VDNQELTRVRNMLLELLDPARPTPDAFGTNHDLLRAVSMGHQRAIAFFDSVQEHRRRPFRVGGDWYAAIGSVETLLGLLLASSSPHRRAIEFRRSEIDTPALFGPLDKRTDLSCGAIHQKAVSVVSREFGVVPVDGTLKILFASTNEFDISRQYETKSVR